MILNGLWARFRTTDGTRAKRLGVATVTVFLGSFLVCGVAGIRINASPSLPVGLYAATTNSKAPLVEFCPPEPYGSFAIRRGYRTEGACGDGATPLLKPVVAREGDSVEVSGFGVSVNGRVLPNSAPRPTDTAGREMPVWPVHKQIVAPGMVWVVSSYNPRSFDSRYFGPIAVRTITSRLRSVIVAK
jgi:conjugative transfer signal peptidase TraF